MFKKIALSLAVLCTLLVPTLSIAQSLEPIHVDQAFQFSATARDYQTIIAMWKIAPGYHLYRDRFHFKVVKPDTARLGQPLLPDGSIESTPGIGSYQVYKNAVSIPIPVISTPSQQLILQVRYQGCSEKGYCYPPTTKVVQINLAGDYGMPVQGLSVDIPSSNGAQAAPKSWEAKVSGLLAGKGLLLLLISFLGFGVLVSLTPCVLPMIPILSSIIIGQKNITHRRSFGLSVAYVLGMAITYAIAGIIFGWLGGSVQAALQKPWILISFTIIFVLLALSMFGFYNIELPAKLRNKFAHASDHQKRGSYLGVALMGCLSTLILSPCVTPPLVAVLGYISQTGNAFTGGAALFSMGIGMGVPLLLIGAFGAKILPKAGVWMNVIKNMLGILLLGIAILMLERIISASTSLILWAALAIGTGIYCGALSTAKNKAQFFGKFVGLVLFIYGIVLLVGLFAGNTNPLTPFNFKKSAAEYAGPKFIRVKTVNDVKAQLAIAKENKQYTMLDFYADWCISCKEMDHFTFSNPKVKARLYQFHLLRADVTANDIQDKTLERRYGVIAPPTMIFFGPDGKEIKSTRIIGELSATKFLTHLNSVKPDVIQPTG